MGAANINRVTLTGNLTKDPELRTTPGGTSVCSLRVAVNSRVKRDGEWSDKPNYFDVTVWGGQGENCATYLVKGRGVAIDGRLDWHEWEPKGGGSKRQSVQIIAETVQFLYDGDGGGGGGRRSSPGESVPGDDSSSSMPGDGSGSVPAPDDDIPF